MPNIQQPKLNSGAATGKQQVFCILQHSVMAGQTVRHAITGLILQILHGNLNFYKYMHDAFSPIGLMIDFWDDKIKKGTETDYSGDCNKRS